MRQRLIYAALSAVMFIAQVGAAKTASVDKSGDANDSNTLQTVVVTAQKFKQNLQRVPIAVTALNAKTLDAFQIGGLQGLKYIVPNIYLAQNPGSSNGAEVYMRGVGDDDATMEDELPIGIWVDGVYYAHAIGSSMDFLDVKQVEVLRGPQGALYGENAAGGAIKIVLNHPNFDGPSFRGDMTGGSFGRFDVRGTANIPISDRLAALVSFISESNDGYYTNVANGDKLNRKDVRGGRLSLEYNPTNRLSLYSSVDFTHDNSGLQVGTPMTESTPPYNSKQAPLYGCLYCAEPTIPDRVDFYGGGVTFQAKYHSNYGNFESISAYRGISYHASLALSPVPQGTNIIRDTHERQFTQEFQFVSEFRGPFQVLGGLFFLNDQSREDMPLSIPTIPLTLAFDTAQHVQSYAAYAQGSYRINHIFNLILGGRETMDKKDITWTGLFNTHGAARFNKFTPTATLNAQLTPDIMTYVTWAQGFQAGAFQGFPGSQQAAGHALPPLTANSYEIGAKTEWFDRRLRANLALFYVKYTDLQLAIAVEKKLIADVTADYRVEGAELTVDAVPLEGLTVHVNASVEPSKFLRVPGGGVGPLLTDRAKDTPLASALVGADYTLPIKLDGHVTVGATYSWTDTTYYLNPNPGSQQPAYSLVNARLAYSSQDDKWGVELGGKNLTNTHYFTADAYFTQFIRYYQPGATWYLRLKYNL